MKLLTDFCVSQLIPSLCVKTECKIEIDNDILSFQEFLFTFCLPSAFNFSVLINAQLFVLLGSVDCFEGAKRSTDPYISWSALLHYC